MSLKLVLIAVSLLSLVVIILFLNRRGVSEKSNNKDSENNKIVLENKNMMTQLSTEEYKELIRNEKVWNLDVRESYEFNAGHIEGANLVPSTRFDEFFDELKIKKGEKIAVYCRSGSRSAFIGQKLAEKGYESIYNLELGLIDWKRKGFETVE